MLLVDVHRDNMVCEGLHTLTDWDRIEKAFVEPDLVQIVQPELDMHGIKISSIVRRPSAHHEQPSVQW